MKEYEVTKTITTKYRCFVKADDWEEAEEEATSLDVWTEISENERTDCEEVEEC